MKYNKTGSETTMTSWFSEKVVEGSGAMFCAATILGTAGMTFFSDQNY